MANKINYLYIDKSQGASGYIEFIHEDFFDLKPGSFVIQIGDGRENGCFRTDKFTRPFRYSGAFLNGKDKLYAFQVPEEMLPAKSDPHYLLYESTGSEIIRRVKDHNRFFAPVFVTGTQEDINMRTVYMDGDVNDGYESKIRKSNGRNKS